jgi:two-component system sensor histidine kinase CssS
MVTGTGCRAKKGNAMKKLNGRSLAVQIWLVFAFVLVVVFILLSIYFGVTIRRFFTEEVYRSIEAAQKNVMQKYSLEVEEKEEEKTKEIQDNIREVKHFKINNSKDEANLEKLERLIPNEAAAGAFIKKIRRQVTNQDQQSQRYIQRLGNGRILYVINIIDINKKNPTIVVSYMWDTYRNSLSVNLMKKLIAVMVIALIISLIAAKYMAQKLVVPLRQLAEKVKKIGKKQWHESVDIDSKDEIGELSRSVEIMRKELIAQDEYEQRLLQQASHDLKTPLMVIRSYVQAVEDGIFPKGDLQSTMQVIDSQAERMQKRIKNLLYLTKINYMSKQNTGFSSINIRKVIEKVTDTFIYNERNITFQLDLTDFEVKGEDEQWNVVFENLIDNQLRYADSMIKIKIYEDDKSSYISIYNDGEQIPEDKLNTIFGTFNKDKGGNFGLGLAIIKRIVNMYGYDITAKNENHGVSFIIRIERK